jgi:hypothetical protein
MSHRGNLECHTPLDGRAWEFGMGWVEMGEREPRPAEEFASAFAEQLTTTAASGLIGVIRGQRKSIRFPSSVSRAISRTN